MGSGHSNVSQEDFHKHLLAHFRDKDMYSMLEYDNKNLMVNPVLTGDKLSFDVPKSLLADALGIKNKNRLKSYIEYENSYADGSWESSSSNFLHIIEDGDELAVINPTKVKVT